MFAGKLKSLLEDAARLPAIEVRSAVERELSALDESVIDKLWNIVGNLDPYLRDRRHIECGIARDGYCVSYRNPWRFWHGNSRPVAQLQFVRKSQLICKARAPLDATRSQWIYADSDLDIDPENDYWVTPTRQDQLTTFSDGTVVYDAPFTVYLHFPNIRVVKPGGRYSRAVILPQGDMFSVDSDIEITGKTDDEVASKIAEMIVDNGGPERCAVWLSRE